jgi:degradative hydroxymethylglutaryl-CoA reductase
LIGVNFDFYVEEAKVKPNSVSGGGSIWAGFHQKSVKDRVELLKRIYPTIDEKTLIEGSLNSDQADMMIENWVGILPLPLGLGLNFKINGKKYVIPMAIEEPSVIAAASSAAKFISERAGGFYTHTTEPVMAAQIQIIGVNYDVLKYKLDKRKQEIIDYSNNYCKSMVKRGGGVKGMRHRKIYEIKTNSNAKDVIVVELLVDVRESMGMNIWNTIAEATSEYIMQLLDEGKLGLRITSNLCLERMATSFFKVPVEKLNWKEKSGKEVAEGIMNAYRFACEDKFRAVTHNKGRKSYV